MHKFVLLVAPAWLLILLTAQSDQAFILQVALYLVHPVDNYVESQIKLVAIEQQRILNILLDNHVTSHCLWNLFQTLKQIDTVAHASVGWLCNKERLLLLVEPALVLRKHETFWDKIKRTGHGLTQFPKFNEFIFLSHFSDIGVSSGQDRLVSLSYLKVLAFQVVHLYVALF